MLTIKRCLGIRAIIPHFTVEGAEVLRCHKFPTASQLVSAGLRWSPRLPATRLVLFFPLVLLPRAAWDHGGGLLPHNSLKDTCCVCTWCWGLREARPSPSQGPPGVIWEVWSLSRLLAYSVLSDVRVLNTGRRQASNPLRCMTYN